MRVPILVCCFFLVMGSSLWANDALTVATFNIRSFSSKSRSDEELALIADRLQGFDLCAIQELRDSAVLHRLLQTLAARGDEDWAWLVSAPVGRGSKELLAFLYRPSRVSPLSPVTFLPDPADRLIRDAAWAMFRRGTFDFACVTVHLLWGDSSRDRALEAIALGEMLAEARRGSSEADWLVLGDFNQSPDSEAFDSWRDAGWQSVNPGLGTTLADSPFDTLWYVAAASTEYRGEWGIDDFDQRLFQGDSRAASLAVSDHRPLWAVFLPHELDDD